MTVTKKSLLHRPTLHNFSFVIIIPICLLLTLIAFNQTWKWEHQKIQAGFEGTAQNLFSALEREIESNLETLLALKALYTTSPSITRSQFRDFVRPLLSHHPSIQALEWIPLVTDSQRGKYEAAAKKDGFPDFEITERLPQGKIIRASKRKEYFPVYFVEPYEGNSLALGFDLASNPTRLEALELSREIGEMVATGRVTLVQEIGKQFGFLVFLPIYRDDSTDSTQVPGENLKGFVLGVFRIGDILEKSLTYLKPEGVNIYLYDKSASKEERFLYFHKSGTKTGVSSLMSDKNDEHKPGQSIEYSKTLDLADRKWELRYTPTPEYITARKSWQPWGVLLGGLLLTGLLATYLGISFNRTKRIERLVRDRTNDLQKTNDRLAKEIGVRTQAEEALQKAHDALDTRVKERTAELLKSNEQLRHEIDERLRAEKEIANLAKFPSEDPNPVLRLNQEGFILYANDSSEVLLKSWGCAVGESAPPFWRQLITDTLQHRSKGVTEVDLNGEIYGFFVNPIPDAGYVNLYGIDITERKRAEEALRESEQEAQRLAREEAVIAAIGRIISSTLNIEDVYERFVKEVRQLITFDRLVISIINEKDGTVSSTYVSGTSVPGRKPKEIYPLAGSINAQILRTRKSVLVQTEDEKELAANFPTLLNTFQAGLRSMMSVPLFSHDQVIGILHLRSRKAKAYTDDALKLAETIAAQIAGAIANAQLFEELKRAEEILRRGEEEAKRLAQENAAMAEIGRIISSSLNIDEVYGHFAEEVRKLLSFDRISINLVDLENNTSISTYIAGVDIPGRQFGDITPLKGTAMSECMRTRASLLIQPEKVEEWLVRFPALLPTFQTGLRSIVYIPLISKDQVIGALSLRSTKANAYTDRDVKLAENIGNQIAEAIANAQLFNELKRSEKALQRNDILLRNVLDALPVGVAITDKEGKVISNNPARSQIWGMNQFKSITQLGKYRGWWADTGRKVEVDEWGLARAVKEGETSINRMMYIETFDGQKKTILNSGAPIRDVNGEMIGAIGVIQDITELKQAEERLRHSEEHFRSLIENSSDMIIEGDKNGAISYISPSVERMLGYKLESVIGKNAFEFVHPDDLKETWRAHKYLDRDPLNSKAIECRVRHFDGSWRIFQSFRKIIFADGSNPVVIVNSRDITEQKNLESQLGQAQKLEAVGQLAAGIAHEINTPTQYVGDNTRFLQEVFRDLNHLLERHGQLLQDVKAGKDPRQFVQEVEAIVEKIDLPYLTAEIPRAIEQTLEGVERVTKIVRAMKEFSHPGVKEKSLADINKAIENTITVSRNEWKYVAEMVTDFDSSLPPVPCLLGEFNQAILNIIINAAHAIADVGGDGSGIKGTIKVSTRHDHDWAEIRVSDTGTGIPENIRSRIFDPFFTTKQVGKGTGQGLAISHSVIVKKHGGTIDFETEMGKGTTFIIRLPLANGAKGQGVERGLGML